MKNTTPNPNQNFEVFVIRGRSMQPLLPEGTQIVVLKVTKGLKTGDLAVFSNSHGEKCSHRIIQILEGKIITKGDNTVFRDTPISIKKIEGIAWCYRDETGDFWKLRPNLASKQSRLIFGVQKFIYFCLRSKRLRLSRLPRKQLTRLGFRQKMRTKMKATRFEVQKLGKELMIYDHETDSLHTLNETAALIWELSNQNKSEQDIVSVICEKFEISDQNQVQQDVKETFKELKQFQILNN